MKRSTIVHAVVSIVAIVWLGMGACPHLHAQSTQSPLPEPTGYVNDYAGVIDGATRDRLEKTLANLDREQQIQFAVVTINTTGDRDIFDYSLAVARGWGLGSKDTAKPSLLLLAAIKDRKYFTQVSRHLEGDLPDGLVGQIQREQLVPAFRLEQYGRGLTDTVYTYIKTIAAKNGFGTDSIFLPGGSGAPVRSARPQTNGGLWIYIGLFIIVAIVLVVIRVLSRRGGKGGPGGGSSILDVVLLSLLAGSDRGHGSSGWRGGGFGGFGGGGFGGGGGGGGGFGGFGGGGDFGGGGSGGSW